MTLNQHSQLQRKNGITFEEIINVDKSGYSSSNNNNPDHPVAVIEKEDHIIDAEYNCSDAKELAPSPDSQYMNLKKVLEELKAMRMKSLVLQIARKKK